MEHKRGTTYIDTLITICISVCFLPLMTSCLRLSMHFIYDDIQNEIGLIQLRSILALSQNISCDHNVLYFTYAKQEYQLYEINERLMMAPGTQFVLCDVSNVEFIHEGKYIYIIYEEQGERQKRALSVA